MVGAKQKISVLRYVLAAVAIKAIIAVGFTAIPYLVPNVDVDDLPNLGTPVTVAASILAISWYKRDFAVPLPLGAFLRFGTGVMFGDLLLSAGLLVFALVEAGAPFTVAGLNTALLGGDQSDDLVITILAAGAIAGGLITFVASASVAWFMTKNLSRNKEVFE